jgi:hypothetical protein
MQLPAAAAMLFQLLLLRLAPAAAELEAATSVQAVEKVIELLRDMEAKAKAEKNDESVEYAKFEQFCKDTAVNKQKEIDADNLLIEELSSTVEKLESDIAGLEEKIAALKQDIEVAEAGMKAAAEQRAKDHAMYTARIQDQAESVDALERALLVLQKQNYDRKQASEALLQLSTVSGVPESVQRTVAAFLEMQTGDDYLTRDSPEANAYEFQSGTIIDLLKKLRDDFAKQKTESEKEEMNSKHAADMLSQDLNDQIEAATADIADKSVQLEEKKQLLAEMKKQLAATIADRDENVAYLAELKVECDEKSKSFHEKQDLRDGELRSIAKAIEILSSPDVLGAAASHLPTFLQLRGKRTVASSFAQLRRSGGTQPDAEAAEGSAQHAVMTFLEHEGRRLHSTRLGLLAQKVAADPFAKVKKLIEEMIQRLLREAGEESEHKGWCDTELGTNKITRTKLQDTIDSLTAKIDQEQAFIAESTERLATLSKEVAELNTAMMEATKLREAESAKNTATIKDAAAAQRAIEAATALLKEFYAKAGTATAFVQVHAGKEKQRPTDFAWQSSQVRMGTPEWDALANPNAPELDQGHREGMQTFGTTYKGLQDESEGVFGLLEVISSDFSVLEKETKAAEDQALALHEDFMATSRKSVAVKDKESEMLNADLAQANADLAIDTKDLKDTQDQLLAANRVYDNLKPSCVDSGMTYEKRVAAREEEIQSLKEALHILEGGAIG